MKLITEKTGKRIVGAALISAALLFGREIYTMKREYDRKYVQIIDIDNQRYWIDNNPTETRVSFNNQNPYIGSIILRDTNKDGNVDEVIVSQLGPRPSGGVIKISPSKQYQTLFNKVLSYRGGHK